MIILLQFSQKVDQILLVSFLKNWNILIEIVSLQTKMKLDNWTTKFFTFQVRLQVARKCLRLVENQA